MIKRAWLMRLVVIPLLANAYLLYAVENDYRLGSGDRIKVTVFRHEDLSGEFEVNGAGRIHLPLIQEVQAAGLTAQELEQVITDKLKPDYLKEPRGSVQILTYRPFYILGEVNSPGSYSYVSGMTVVTAIARAGGYTYRAKQDYVYISRAGDSEKKKQRADPNTPVYPGDVIEVPERLF